MNVTDLSYAELLDHLRRDLQLDLARDTLHGDKAARNNLGIAVGLTSLAFAASTNSTTVVIKHGLLRVPSLVLAGAQGAPGFTQIPLCNTFSYTTTTFSLNAVISAALTGSINAVWLAIE